MVRLVLRAGADRQSPRIFLAKTVLPAPTKVILGMVFSLIERLYTL